MKPSLLLLFQITFLGSFFLATSEPQADSCTSNLNLKVPIPFDTTSVHCLSVWDAQGFILRVGAPLLNFITYTYYSYSNHTICTNYSYTMHKFCSMFRLLQTFGASFSQPQIQIRTWLWGSHPLVAWWVQVP